MTFDANSKLQEQPASAELYTFTFGTTVYKKTSCFQTLVVGADTFVADSMKRSGYSLSSDMTPAELTVTIVSTSDLAVDLLNVDSMKQLSVSIDRIFLADSTTKNLFKGNMISGLSFEAGQCTIKFQDMLQILDRNVCRVRVQSLCNNALFDPVCALLPSATGPLGAFSVATTVSVDLAGRVLTSPDFGALPDDYFTYGKVLFGQQRRYITNHVGNDVTIAFPLYGLVGGSAVTAYAGCDKHPQTCIDKFNNLANFVGMPYVPLKDPVQRPLTNG